MFSADGADAGSANAGGGGGGRIAVSYASGAAFGGVALSTVSGGAGYVPGEDGTIRFTDTVCDGDRNGDRSVTVDELIRGVNMALGTLPASACSAIDSDGVASVTIDDLLRAVNRALGGCLL